MANLKQFIDTNFIRTQEIKNAIFYRKILKREMEMKGIGGSLGTQVKLNNEDNFFFFFNGKKFEYNNF